MEVELEYLSTIETVSASSSESYYSDVSFAIWMEIYNPNCDSHLGSKLCVIRGFEGVL